MATPAPAVECARNPIRVLVADDAPTLRNCSVAVLRMSGFDVQPCSDGAAALALVARDRFDIVIVEERLQAADGLAILRAALATRSDTRVVITSTTPTAQAAEQAMQAGAWYYLPKPFTATQLQLLAGMAARAPGMTPPAAARSGPAPKALGPHLLATRRSYVTPIGRAPAFRTALALARRVAATDIPVLLTGETGSGKEILAQFIHQHSRRAPGPLVPINCSALPEGLCESELFGHRKGAFTNAVRDKPGLLEVAHDGTLFLDEVLDMPRATQAKLLRVMEDGVVRRVGSEATDATVNVRFLAATNIDPERAVRDGRLREDLYYRLNVMRLHVPPLRERVDDIPLLANLFLTTYWRRDRPKTPIPRLSEAALSALKAHRWRGNLRELQNVIEWAIVSVGPGEVIEPRDLCLSSVDDARAGATRSADDAPVQTLEEARDRFLTDFESRYVRWAVERADGNVANAARAAGVARGTLYRMMTRHGLHRAWVAAAFEAPGDDPDSADQSIPVIV